MKKITAVFTALLMFLLTFAFAFPAGAKTSLITPRSLDDGDDALRAQFGRAELGGMDYNYFVPCDEKNDDHKYPLVVILCGIGEGYKEDQPILRHNFINWSSIEFQRRFTDGGAYIMLPRSPQNEGNFWYQSTVPMLKACLDDFTKNHNVDTSRIYVAGFSIGARMLYQMVDAYPNYFSAAVIMSPYTNATSAEAKLLGRIPVWFFGSKDDAIVNYTSTYKGVFDEIVKNSPNPAACRFSTFTYTVDPSGEAIWNNHESWHAFACDMFFNRTEPWPYCTTADGTGKTVKIEYPNGVISWFNNCVRSEANSSTSGSVRAGFLTKMLAFFRRLLQRVTRLFG